MFVYLFNTRTLNGRLYDVVFEEAITVTSTGSVRRLARSVAKGRVIEVDDIETINAIGKTIKTGKYRDVSHNLLVDKIKSDHSAWFI